jgi:RND family efflux transporter MFP subunit
MQRRVWAWGLVAGAIAAVAVAVPLSGHSWGALVDDVVKSGKRLVESKLGSGVQTAKGAGGQTSGPPPAVTVSQPIVREIAEWDEYTGRFDAVETVDVRARVSGYLTDVHFKDGQDVTQGDLLFVIDPRPFERAVAMTRAELDQAEVRVKNASLDVERGRPLVGRGAISQKVFDDRENLLRDAQAATKVAEAKLRAAELDLAFTRITAPVSGRASRALVDVGNYVSGGGTGSSTATSLTTIVSQDPIHIYFDVSENDAIKYRRLAQQGETGAGGLQAPVQVALPDEEGFPHEGRIDFLDNRLDAGTGTLRMRAVLDNKAGLFSPGMFARVRLRGSGLYAATMLPDEAIGTDQTSRFVYVVGEDAMPQRRSVKLGPLVDGLRVVRGGIVPTDWVVVSGQTRVRPGLAVAPKREPIKLSRTEPAANGPVLKQR